MKVLSGVYPHGSYTGEIYFEGEERRFSGIADSEKLGIIIIHQELALVPLLSIAENIFLGNEPARVRRHRLVGGLFPDAASCCDKVGPEGIARRRSSPIWASASSSSSRSPRRCPRRSSC